MGFLLSILAIGLLFVVHIVDYIFSFFYDVKNKKWFKNVSQRNFKKAFNIDVFANHQYGDFWNSFWSKKGNHYKFGRKGETISSALGKKQMERSLNLFGWTFLIIINIIDCTKWLKRGHCIASIMSEDSIKTNS
ncbi:hypothetical protein [Flavobacterium sp.]|uniref:hypothetical protein n=1 Tax=Flavobacterium sp. TaxID=239 RepID=UPI00261E5BB9|nr:hypothetical protein [Flavobacterium sp.]